MLSDGQNGEPKGVLQDVESYERTRRAIGLLKLLAQGEEDVRAGRATAQDEVFATLRQRLKARPPTVAQPPRIPWT